MFSSTKLQSKMLFFNWQTWIIMCTLPSHLDPFINGLLNTGGIGPKLLAWFWEAQRMRRTQDTKHKNRGVMWAPCWHRRGEHPLPGVMDTAPSQHNLHTTEPWQPHTSQDPALSHHPYSQPQARQTTGNAWKETALLPAIHQKDSGSDWLWDYQEELQQPEEKANPHGLTLQIN